VDKRCASDCYELGGLEVAALGRRGGHLGHTRGMADEVRGSQVGEVAHRRNRKVDLLALEHEVRERLEAQRSLPCRVGGIKR
jgi:hypothetical protein